MRWLAKVATMVALLVCAGVLALVVWWDMDGGPAPAPTDEPDRTGILATATVRIAGEARRGVPPLQIEAAPLGDASGPDEQRRQDRRPNPPRGYTFVGHGGEMTKARTERPDAGVPDYASPPWLEPRVGVAALTDQASAAGRGWTFGYIRLADGATPAGLARDLLGTGAELVGGSGGLVRARLTGDPSRLRAIAALDAVSGLGATPPNLKVAGFGDAAVVGTAPVYVTLMADDADGRWRREMEGIGAVVGGYDPALRVYRANADAAVIEALAEADFVLSVEPIPVVWKTHDTAVPAMGADALRTWDGAPGLFVGVDGASVPVAIMDTGLNIRHPDISHHRDSVCGSNFAHNPFGAGPGGTLVEEDDLWVDSEGHGTHVTGTLAGNGVVQQRFAGMAPGVRHIRFAKVLSTQGTSTGDSVEQGMNYLARASGCGESEVLKPLVVNMSLSSSRRIYEGRDVGARKLDSVVWSHRQLYVVAQSNDSIHGFSQFGAAKNSLSVGAAMDDGALATFSSHGPTFDGRLAPNVVGTGVRVHSARGDASEGGYVAAGGTSMASPAVAGVAVLLMDAAPAHRERPALARARLMASAIRPDPWLAEGGGFPSDNTAGPGPWQARFGMGKVSARTAVLDRDRSDGWTSGSATAELVDGEYAWRDIDVPIGASRLDLVMTWDEPPADALTSTVLNDLDLYLDRDADCGPGACGEHASRSRIDNVEWIVVRNPEPGTYRAKVLAYRVYATAPRAAVAWTVIRGASTPTLSIEADRDRIAGVGEHEVTLTVSADAYVAAGTRLHIDCRTDGPTACADLVEVGAVGLLREDTLTVDLSDEAQTREPDTFIRTLGLGSSIPLGEIAVGEKRQVALRLSVAEGADAAAVLHFTASAWNGRAGSASVRLGPNARTDFERPANDDFAAASAIAAAQGAVALDLLHATPEPGEPVFEGRRGRPAGSVWYAWTAPSDGLFRFGIPALAVNDGGEVEVARYDRLHVFEGERLTGLRELASSLSAATFPATAGRTYRIRVASSSRGTAMDLRWSPGGLPPNDDLANAILLEGATGSIEGSSAGATLEPGESFGGLAATTWFRWRAPEDGAWFFESPGRRVLAFEGDDIASLRLVSGRPGENALFAAGEEREYFVAVAEQEANQLGGDYALNWTMSGIWGDDMFAGAEPIDDGAQEVGVRPSSTVEPGEPPETGVRTRWSSWRAPRSGTYTLRLGDMGETEPSSPKLRLTVFEGGRLEDLRLVAEMGPWAPFRTLLDAVSGETYRIATGLRNGDEAAYVERWLSGNLTWGPTPANDERSGAERLVGTSGSASASSDFATGARGESSAVLGRATLWWAYEAAESGWVGFAVDGDGGPWVLTVHRESAAGGLEVVASSLGAEGDADAAEVLFEAEEGVRYTISVGVTGGGRGGQFTLHWDPSEAPTRLHYVGRLADGGLDSRGDPVEIRNPAGLAVHASGTALYLASEIGLQVFERDPGVGTLDLVQLLDVGPYLGSARLLWDDMRERLLVDECGVWRSFSASGDGLGLEDLGELKVADDPGSCALDLLMDADGSHLYRVGERGIEHFVVEDEGAVAFSEATDEGGLAAAVLSNSGGQLYARTGDRLLVFTRDPESGALSERVALEDRFFRYNWAGSAHPSRVPLAVSEDDAFLFAFDRFGERVHVYSLDDPTRPDRVDTLEYAEPAGGGYCRFADTRGEVTAVDVFCDGFAFAARWDPGAGRLLGADTFSAGGRSDLTGEIMPYFEAVGLSSTPDDRHLYLTTRREGILVFARSVDRVGGEASDTGHLVLRRAWSTTDETPAGSTFRLSALVLNRGAGSSDGVTVRFYLSDDETISSADSEVGSVDLGVLEPSESRSRSLDVTAPARPGLYRYGACVDAPAGSAADADSCSGAVAVTVTDAEPGVPDLAVDSASVDVGAAIDPGASFTFSAVVRNKGDADSPVAMLRYYRSSNRTVSASDDEIATESVAGLAAGAKREVSAVLATPAERGTYWYGACVDDVPNEIRARNNCSAGVEVEVSGGGEEDDHGDSFDDATAVAVPSTSKGDIGEDGDRDYFQPLAGHRGDADRRDQRRHGYLRHAVRRRAEFARDGRRLRRRV